MKQSLRQVDDPREWLVEARNEIQSLMFRLYRRKETNNPPMTDRTFQFSVGAAFSLWRAVFLIDAAHVTRTSDQISHAAQEFLRRVVDTNNIGFGDDWKKRTWTSGYYVNNAAYRVSEMEGHVRSLQAGTTPLKDAWCDVFERLQPFVDGRKQVVEPKP